jgi:hypothetical protein
MKIAVDADPASTGRLALKLVRQRGWSVARFQAWLTEALQVQMLGQGGQSRSCVERAASASP